MLHPPEAGVDTLDADFREWAFDGKISLRTIDERLKTTEPGRIGWNREGLESLKKWILASQAEKYRAGNNSAVGGSYSVMDWAEKYDWRAWSDVDLAHCGYVRPVDVYWYFRKNGKITEDDDLYGGHEEIDLYCISRFGSQCDVKRTVRNDITYQTMDISYPESERKSFDKMVEEARDEEELEKKDYRDRRLLFYVPSAFKSIRECLVFHNDDASVSGDQLMGDVRGNGRVAMPKLAIMEGLLANLMEGLGFAAQVTWSVQPGTAPEYLDQLERGHLRSGQSFPNTVKLMDKQNSMTNFQPAMNAISMLDRGVAADSVAAQQGTFGSAQADFADQAAAQMSQANRIATRRLHNWLKTLEQVSIIGGRTLCRHWPDMKKSYPCYWDANRMRMLLKRKFRIHEDEWAQERWDFTARTLSGGMTKDRSVQINMQAIQLLGPIYPTLLPFFGKEILRAWFGDKVASMLTGPKKEEEKSQMESAQARVSQSFVMGTPAETHANDNPMIHSGVAAKLAMDRTTAAGEAGTVAKAEVVGIMAVLQYAASQMQRMPQDMAKQGLERLEQVAKAIQSVPITAPPPIDPVKAQELQIKAGNQERLVTEGQRKYELASNAQTLKLDDQRLKREMHASQQQALAVQRAQGYAELEANAAEQNAIAPAPL